jgi:flagellar biogenesis protein FliO
MFHTLFGEGQYGLKMLFAFIVVFGLLALALWLVRQFGGKRLGNPAARGRQPRLAIIDAATVDARRRLVLIRRDNVEHLLIIGGPTDVVIEQNIVRAAGALREAPAARPSAASDTLPRAVPLGEGSMWPLQPEPGPRIEPMLRPDPAPRPQRPAASVEESAQWTEPEQPPSPPQPPQIRERRTRSAEPLAGLAEEMTRSPPAEVNPAESPVRPIELVSRQQARRAPRPHAVPPPPPASAPADAELNAAADQNLAAMAHRLEAALRRPAKDGDGDSGPSAAAPAPPGDEEKAQPASAVAGRAATPPGRPVRADIRPGRSDGKPPQQKSLYDSLEQEMASLLGRPGKP